MTILHKRKAADGPVEDDHEGGEVTSYQPKDKDDDKENWQRERQLAKRKTKSNDAPAQE